MSHHLIPQIQQVSSVSSSTSSIPLHFPHPLNPKQVKFQTDFSSTGIEKISQFVDIHKLTLEHFWKSDKHYFGYDDIREMCENVGLRLGYDDEVDIKQELFHTNLVIGVYEFKDKVRGWRGYTVGRIDEFMGKRGGVLDDESILGRRGGKENGGSMSYAVSREKKVSRPFSSISRTQTNVHTLPAPTLSSSSNKSLQYLKLQKIRARQQETKLLQAINKAKNQQQYQILLKMGEANDKNKELNSLLTFRAYKNAQGNLKVKVFNLDKFDKEINLEEFQREYNGIRKRYEEAKNMNVWEMLAGSGGRDGRGRGRGGKEEGRGEVGVSKKNMKTMEREKKKKKMVEILADTISLTNVFKDQLRILKTQGIYKKNI